MRLQTPTELGTLLRGRRLALGLSQAELAARVGASRQWVVEVEAGKPRAELALVLRALAAVNLTLEAVVDEPSRTPRVTQKAPAVDSRWGEPVDIDAIIARARQRSA